MKNACKAIQAIERLVGGDFGMEMDFLSAKDEKGKWLTKKPTRPSKTLREAAALISEIYMIAHAEGTCTGHPSWENRKYEILKQDEL